MKIARVIVNLSLDRAFDYVIPSALEDSVKTGVMVYVPFGRSRRKGYVVGIKGASSYPSDRLKEIESVCDTHPKIPDELLRLAEWICEYYCCSREQAVRALLPSSVRSGKIKHRLSKTYYLSSIEDAHKYILEAPKKYAKRKELLKYLIQNPGAYSEIIQEKTGISAAVLKQLVKDGQVVEEKNKAYRNPIDESIEILRTIPHELTGEQQNALDMIVSAMNRTSAGRNTILLYGVTGSGKTEVYMRAIDLAIKNGKNAIVLVPEIALTPQTTERFIGRFGNMVSVLHSRLGEGERFDEWMKIFHGEVKIVVGARSALFAPFRQLGVIIVDEEHENSYKQEEAPRYNARDIAVLRGTMEKAVVILGSATPSFESYHNAKTGKYALAELKTRADNRFMPKMSVINMRDEALAAGKAMMFSRPLVEAIRDRLAKGEQVIIFLNRRGFATQMICPKCAFVATCSECSIAYTYHKKRACLACHMCGAVIKAYLRCPSCGADDIKYSGFGTERIENTLGGIFPTARIVRMDSDTMAGKRRLYEKALMDFSAGKTNILIGTQMIAKGLHFPNVTLVGIVNADLSLHMPEFRASERTFQLLTQVAGRAGRGDVSGHVFVQTYTPMAPAVQFALKHDYEGFYNGEMEVRKLLKYPPVGHLFVVHFRGPVESDVAKFADHFLELLRPHAHQGIMISGPTPAPLTRIKGKYRYMLIFRGGPMKSFRSKLREIIFSIEKSKDVEFYADIDAVSLL